MFIINKNNVFSKIKNLLEFNIFLPFGRSYNENLGTDTINFTKSGVSEFSFSRLGGMTAPISSDAYIDIPYTLDINKFSIGAWFKRKQVTNIEVIWKWGNQTQWAACLREYTTSPGIYVMNGAAVSATPSVTIDVWNHTVITFDVNTWKLYRNGALINTGTKTYIGDIANLTLGIFHNPSNTPEIVQGGSISNFFLTKNKVLDNNEILNMYHMNYKPYYG
jgi:hypothetical protein